MDKKKTYIIAGANGGVGSSLCSILKNENTTVIAAVRDLDAAKTNPKLNNCTIVRNDFENWKETEEFFQTIQQKYSEITGVANCIGSILLKPAHLTKEDEFIHCMQKNIGTAFSIIRAAARPMMKTGGSIVLVSSAVAKHGYSNHEAIAAAKAGILGLVKSAAATYARNNIRINAVLPGLVETPLSHKITSNEVARKASEGMHALGRIGQPDEVARAIHFLLQPEQSWITGQELAVDGGLSSLHC
jgi:NAD(P)-dependent dehydrogenase (short-subunit alcohol dehydrogenase family)